MEGKDENIAYRVLKGNTSYKILLGIILRDSLVQEYWIANDVLKCNDVNAIEPVNAIKDASVS